MSRIIIDNKDYGKITNIDDDLKFVMNNEKFKIGYPIKTYVGGKLISTITNVGKNIYYEVEK